MNGYKLLCLFLISVAYKARGQDTDSENEYDIGCYQRHEEFVSGDILQSLRNGEAVPNCEEGGLYRATQCGLFNCSCVFIDTGNVNNDVDTGNLTVDELVPICPNLTETVVDSCVQPPLEFPCNLRNIKYWYNNETQMCEEVTFGCYGFVTRDFCEENCSTEEVEVDIDVAGRYRFRVRVPRRVLSRYDLELGRLNFMDVQSFIDLTNVAVSVRVIEETTTTTTTTTTTATTTSTIPPTTTEFEPQIPEEVVARRLGSPRTICRLQRKAGPCRGFFPRWYFDPTVSRCIRFTYGGCMPNGNNFQGHAECGRYCGAANPPTDEDLNASIFGRGNRN